MTMNRVDFDYIRNLVREHTAIVLEDGKEYLVESRLAPLVRQEGHDGLGELIAWLRTKPFNGMHEKILDAMTTNETSFFRDVHPFEALKNVVIPDLMTRRVVERTLNLWCAACSSGQEPYSIAMLLREYFPELVQWKMRFIASDISQAMLQHARTGSFSQLEINRGMPASLLVKYFQKNGLQWQIKHDLRQRFEFCQINLAHDWPILPRMDVVFIRNVLIYFDIETKRQILGKVRRLLKPDGYLFLGGAETTMNLDDGFERIQIDKASCYRLRFN